MTPKEALAPLDCPFCGDQGFLKSYDPKPGSTVERWYVECRNEFRCSASTIMRDSEEEAIAAWNRRTPAPSPAVEKLCPHPDVPERLAKDCPICPKPAALPPEAVAGSLDTDLEWVRQDRDRWEKACQENTEFLRVAVALIEAAEAYDSFDCTHFAVGICKCGHVQAQLAKAWNLAKMAYDKARSKRKDAAAPKTEADGWDEHDKKFPGCDGDRHTKACDKATGERPMFDTPVPQVGEDCPIPRPTPPSAEGDK